MALYKNAAREGRRVAVKAGPFKGQVGVIVHRTNVMVVSKHIKVEGVTMTAAEPTCRHDIANLLHFNWLDYAAVWLDEPGGHGGAPRGGPLFVTHRSNLKSALKDKD